MQRITALQNEECAVGEEMPIFERRQFTQKRMERWIRLQQFVFGLPDDYSYAICTTTQKNGKFRSRTLVKVGWMSWYGDGRGSDRQHSLAVSLLDTVEALSANSSAVFWHTLGKWFNRGVSRLRRRPLASPAGFEAPAASEQKQLELMAG